MAYLKSAEAQNIPMCQTGGSFRGVVFLVKIFAAQFGKAKIACASSLVKFSDDATYVTVEISIDLGVCDCLHTEAYVSLKSQTMTKSQITADSVGKATHIKLKTEESTD